MLIKEHKGCHLHFRTDGDPRSPALVFLNSLGTDLRLWDAILDEFTPSHLCVRMDKRGHGLSDAPEGPYSVEELAADAYAVMDAVGITSATLIGCSIGGLIAQAMAAGSPKRVRGLVLSNTAAKIGTREMWDARIAGVRSMGLDGIADSVMERWFSERFRGTSEVAGWRNGLIRTPTAGYIGCCEAVAAADFTVSSREITAPTVTIGGSADGSTPAEIVQGLADLIPDASCRIIEGVGHLPCAEAPREFKRLVRTFLSDNGL